MKRFVLVTLGLAGFLLAWQFGIGLTTIPDYLVPRPSDVLGKFADTLPVQLSELGVTASTTLTGLALALASGVVVALTVTYIQPLRAIVLPVFAAFNGIPKIAIAPLLVTWFGLGAEPKILLAFLLGFFPLFVNAATGLSEVEPDLLDLAKLSGGTELRIFFKVRLMHALPYLLDALKVAFPLALAGSIVGEFIGGNRGVGYLILSGQFNLDTPLVFASLLSITLFTTAGMGALILLEWLFLAWRPSRRRA